MSAEENRDATPAQEAAKAENERLAQLERENSDLKDRLLRALAEMENLRRRTEREIQDTRAFSITKFASDMIGRRTISVAPSRVRRRAKKAMPSTRPSPRRSSHCWTAWP